MTGPWPPEADRSPDERLRQLERRWSADPHESGLAQALIQERLRSGCLAVERVRWAARLGFAPAAATLGIDAVPSLHGDGDAFALCLESRENGLDDLERVALAVAFAEPVVAVWERFHPDDPCLRQALETARRWVAGSASPEELGEAHRRAKEAATRGPGGAGAEAAAAACSPDLTSVSRHARDARGVNDEGVWVLRPGPEQEAMAAELDRQRDLLCRLLCGLLELRGPTGRGAVVEAPELPHVRSLARWRATGDPADGVAAVHARVEAHLLPVDLLVAAAAAGHPLALRALSSASSSWRPEVGPSPGLRTVPDAERLLGLSGDEDRALHDEVGRWTCDCVERGLELWRKERPEELRLDRAVETMRRWIDGGASVEEVADATDAALAGVMVVTEGRDPVLYGGALGAVGCALAGLAQGDSRGWADARSALLRVAQVLCEERWAERLAAAGASALPADESPAELMAFRARFRALREPVLAQRRADERRLRQAALSWQLDRLARRLATPPPPAPSGRPPAMRDARLVAISGPHTGLTRNLYEARASIGASSDRYANLRGDPEVAEWHVTLRYFGGQWLVQPRAPVAIDGALISGPRVLPAGGALTVGQTVLRLEPRAAAAR